MGILTVDEIRLCEPPLSFFFFFEPPLSLGQESRKQYLGGAKSRLPWPRVSVVINMLRASGSASHEAFEQVGRNSLYEFHYSPNNNN